MYNMDISIFGYKIGLEILILIGIIYLVLASHTLCGCCNFYSLIEGMDNNTTTNGTSNVTGSVPAKATTKNSTKKEGFTGANINYGESHRGS